MHFGNMDSGTEWVCPHDGTNRSYNKSIRDVMRDELWKATAAQINISDEALEGAMSRGREALSVATRQGNMVGDMEIWPEAVLGVCAIRVDELSKDTFISNRLNINWADLPDDMANSMAEVDTMTFLPIENINQALRANSGVAPTWVVRDVAGRECHLRGLAVVYGTRIY